MSLKGNQGNLHEDVEQLFEWTRKSEFQGIAHEFYQTVDGGHGRLEIRRHWSLDGVEHLLMERYGQDASGSVWSNRSDECQGRHRHLNNATIG